MESDLRMVFKRLPLCLAGLTCAAEAQRLPFCPVCTIHEVGKLVSPKHLPRRILHRQHLNTVKAVTKKMQCLSQTTYTYPCPKTQSSSHVRTLEISTQRSINSRPAILTTLWEHFPSPLSIYGILSLSPHWASKTLLNSKMSLTVFIFFNRFSLTSLLNNQFLCM